VKPLKQAIHKGSTRDSAICPLVLLGIYLVVWFALAIDPLYRHDWMLENVLPLIAVPLLIFTYRSLRFTNGTYLLLWIFMLLHAIGAHYTYAEVPYDDWFEALSGHRLNDLLGWQRNHFDRLLHFLYGFLLFPVFWELLAPHISCKSENRGSQALRLLLVITFIMSHAGIYEVVEWAAAEFFGGDLGVAYLGTQGDEWDAQKDMGLAMIGTLLMAGLMMGLQMAGAVGPRKIDVAAANR
jgi:putative membrane protein